MEGEKNNRVTLGTFCERKPNLVFKEGGDIKKSGGRDGDSGLSSEGGTWGGPAGERK